MVLANALIHTLSLFLSSFALVCVLRCIAGIIIFRCKRKLISIAMKGYLPRLELLQLRLDTYVHGVAEFKFYGLSRADPLRFLDELNI